jgi:hypothetical protein
MLLIGWIFSMPAKAVTLDWDNLAWTPGALTMTYSASTVASSSTYVDTTYAGLGSVRITISGSTAVGDGFINSTTPNVSTTPDGGNSAQNVLHLEVNWSSDTSDSVTVLVEFLGYSTGVDTVKYNIYDIDRSSVSGGSASWTDQIRTIRATNLANTAVAATASNYAPSSVQISNNASLNLALTGTNTAAGDSTGGNAYINFGTNIVKAFTFNWGNYAPSTQSDPSQQLIGLSEINFTPRPRVPEVHTGLAAALGCGLMLVLRAFRRFRKP